jgi:hypothetical protein
MMPLEPYRGRKLGSYNGLADSELLLEPKRGRSSRLVW